MTLERFRKLCLAQPGATEQIQWEVDAVFKVGGKMFAVACTDFSGHPDANVCSFKCDDDTFAELCERDGIVPAPYMARAKWVAVAEWRALSDQEFAALVPQGYQLVREGLTKKAQAALPVAAQPQRGAKAVVKKPHRR